MSIQIVIEDPKEIEVHVGVKVPGGATNLVLLARYMGPSEFGVWADTWNDRRDVDVLMQVITGWKNVSSPQGTPVPFGRVELAKLLAGLKPELPSAADGSSAVNGDTPLSMAIVQAYAESLAEGRRGN